MLSTRVGVIPGAIGQTWNMIATTCHFATTFWLFWDEFDRQPQQEDFIKIGDPTLTIRNALPLGRKLTSPKAGGLVLTPGSVVMFARNGQPLHSCVATGGNSLAGYNQVNWFSSPGVNHGYSVHNTNQIRWRGGLLNGNDVQDNVGQWCQLYVVGEGVAKAVVRQSVQG